MAKNYNGLKVVGLRADEAACGLLRIQRPLDYLRKLGADTTVLQKIDSSAWQACHKADFIIAQRQYSQDIINMLTKLQLLGKTVIYEVDDNLLAVPPSSPAYQVYRNGKKELSLALHALEMAHGLTVTSQELAAAYYNRNRNAYFLPNCIDFDMRNWSVPADRDKDLALMWVGGSCYDSETELLTENGFKKFVDLIPGEKVATLNPDTWRLEYQEPIEYINTPYEGNLIFADTKQVNFKVTPNHWMYVANKRPKNVEDFTSIQAEDVYGSTFFCKKDAIWEGTEEEFFTLPEYTNGNGIVYEEKKINMDDWLKLFGFWLADGYRSFKNPAYLQELKKDILTKYDFKIYESSAEEILTYNPQLWNYINQFGKTADRYIPKDILKLSSRQLRILLDWYLKGSDSISKNNNSTKIVARTSSIKLVDNLMEIALKVGLAANSKNNKHNAYEVSFVGINKTNCSIYPKVNSSDQSTVYYKGTVHCVVVPNHTLYVRRNGKAFWCKNTHQEDVPLIGEIVKKSMDKYPKLKFTVCSDIVTVKTIVNDYGLDTDRINIIQDVPVDDYPVVLSHGDIGIAPVKLNKFNMCKSFLRPMEYGAWGIPTVGTRIAPYQRYIDQGVDGWTFSNNDIDAWVEKIGILVENPELRKQMGEAAREKARSLDYNNNIDAWPDAWNQIKLSALAGDVGPPGVTVNPPGANDMCPCGKSNKKYKDCCVDAFG